MYVCVYVSLSVCVCVYPYALYSHDLVNPFIVICVAWCHQLRFFLENIVVYQNKLDKIWIPHSENAHSARQQFVPHIHQYETAAPIESEVIHFLSAILCVTAHSQYKKINPFGGVCL